MEVSNCSQKLDTVFLETLCLEHYSPAMAFRFLKAVVSNVPTSCSNEYLQLYCPPPPHVVLSFLLTEAWTAAPHTPRVVLLGPTGSGKSLQAANLARKYNLVEVDFRQLIEQHIASGSKVGATMKPFTERGMMS